MKEPSTFFPCALCPFLGKILTCELLVTSGIPNACLEAALHGIDLLVI